MKKTLIWMVGLMLLYGVSPGQTADNTRLEIYQVKVGEGHSTLIVTKSTDATPVIYKSVLIDAGKGSKDATLIAQLINDPNVANGQLDVVMVTHHDQDHWGGLPGTGGLLRKRCLTGGSLKAANPNRLKLYMSIRDGNLPTSNRMRENNLNNTFNPNGEDNLVIRHWERDLDIRLLPRSCTSFDISIHTLAINGFRRDGGGRIPLDGNANNVVKNKNSAIATVVWGEFSFLLQGDMYSAGTEGKITRTTTDYRRAEDNRRFPTTWSGGTVQNAITSTRNNSTYSSADFIRLNNSTANQSFAASTAVEFPSQLDNYAHWVANPARWHHELGQTINDYNGTIDEYGYACVALVPHHGALSSSHWFKTSHAIIGSNKNNNNGHPNIKAISSLYNTTGATNFYITYLLDNQVYSGTTINRLTEMRELLNYNYAAQAGEPQGGGYLPDAKVFYLDGGTSADAADNLRGPVGTVGPANLSYFKIIVRDGREFRIETDLRNSSSPEGPLRDWGLCEGR